MDDGRPVAVIARACGILHRLYMKRSMAELDVRTSAAACLFLAAKLEERPRRVADVVSVLVRVVQRENERRTDGAPTPSTPLSMAEEAVLRDALLLRERVVLCELGFRLDVLCGADPPHKYILFYATHIMGGTRTLAQCAWNFLNDSLRTPLCLLLPPHVIATGAIHLAAHTLDMGHALPDGWWTMFDTTAQQIAQVEAAIMQLYDERTPATYIPPEELIGADR